MMIFKKYEDPLDIILSYVDDEKDVKKKFYKSVEYYMKGEIINDDFMQSRRYFNIEFMGRDI